MQTSLNRRRGNGEKSGQLRISYGCIQRSLLLVALTFAAVHVFFLLNHFSLPGDNVDVRLPEHSIPERPASSRATVAYMISLTHCSPLKSNSRQSLQDGASVLRHSIYLNSNENFNVSKSRYGFKMYAIVHPDAKDCAHLLEDAGYELWVRETPINVDDIKGEFLRTKVVTNGCCGEKEYLKLWAYTVNPEIHPIVVHLDIDTLILKPFDDLFDAMLDGDSSPARDRIPIMHGKPLPPSDLIQAYFTRDYNMAQPGRRHVGVQGGFIVLRPSMDSFEEYRQIILEGKFFSGSGWGGKGFGGFYGGMTFQGLVPYFYDEKHPGTAVELNRCIYNNMVDDPRTKASSKPDPSNPKIGQCRDSQKECEDCREVDLSTIYSVHFTLCQKPWTCVTFPKDGYMKLCNEVIHEWFKIRRDLDDKAVLETGDQTIVEQRKGMYWPQHFLGYCKGRNAQNFIPIRIPRKR